MFLGKSEQNSKSETHNIAPVDKIIQKIVETSTADKQLKEDFIRSVLEYAGHTLTDNDLESQAFMVMSGTEKTEEKKIVGSSLLRLFVIEKDVWVKNDPWRRRVVEFVVNQFGHAVVTGERKANKLQNHEYVALITSHIKITEQKYIDLLGMPKNLTEIKKNQTNLLQVINSETGKILLQPFLPRDISSKLVALYKLIENYELKREGLGVLHAYNVLAEELKSFHIVVEKNGTYYGDILNNDFVRKIEKNIEDDFSKNKAIQPSEVQILAGEKKYPLHNVGKDFFISFTVKNNGPGFSYETILTLLEDDTVIELESHNIEIGRLAPVAEFLVELKSKVITPCRSAMLLCELSWKDYDEKKHCEEIEIELMAQKDSVDWDLLARKEPYSLEPVEEIDDLVGRKDLLNRLIAITQSSNIGSVIINGQKRVGKTSIAKTLRSHLKEKGYLVIYIEGGDYVDPSPEKTLSQLGNKICKEINWYEPKTKNICIPVFNDSLSPLTDYLTEVSRLVEDIRIVIILDEFDELPLDLYIRGVLGDAFFLTLRSLCNRPNIGFVLVGSEKMSQIMDYQGEKLNKWKVCSVDYFSTESDWKDYKELIEQPVYSTLEYTESAIKSLFYATAGNPYFTKLVCQNVFSSAIRQRDCHITHTEVIKAKKNTSKEIDKNTFQHFWDDGIFYNGERARQKSINRRRILLALADLYNNGRKVRLEDIISHPLASQIDSVERELDEFVGRKILEKLSDGYAYKVPFFYDWIKERGIHELIATFTELDQDLEEKQREIELQVKSSEIVELVNRWMMYKGQAINEDKIRAWLEQFGRIQDQRLMFNLLCGLRFYTHQYVRAKMQEIYDIVKRGLIRTVEKGKIKRSDILVSYLGGPAKSGSHFAKIFADEAKIYVDNVVEKNGIVPAVENNNEIKAIVFIDDFVGTGNSASEYLIALDQEIIDTINKNELAVFFITIVAFEEGWKKLEKIADKLKFNINLHCCELLDASSKCFNERSILFPDSKSRENASKIARHWGAQLEKKCPLGFGDLEMAIVFERSCPNNTLPILWSESSSINWRPLFKRK